MLYGCAAALDGWLCQTKVPLLQNMQQILVHTFLGIINVMVYMSRQPVMHDVGSRTCQ
jgi:hypothetical protein